MAHLPRHYQRTASARYPDAATAMREAALVFEQPARRALSSVIAACKGGDQFGLFVLAGIGMLLFAPRVTPD